MFIRPEIGQSFRHQMRTVEVDGIVSSADIAVRDMATGERLVVPVSELAPLQAASPGNRLETIPAENWERAKKLKEALIPLINLPRIPKAAIEGAARKCDLSVRQVQRYLAKLRARPMVSSLVIGRVGRKRHGWSLDSMAELAISRCINKFYLVREGKTVVETAERVERMCRLLNIQAPSIGAVSRRIQALNSYDVLSKTKGGKAARQKYQARPGSLRVERPLALVQMDHTRVDVHVVTNDSKRAWLGRPYLTVALDIYSRSVLGFYLSVDPPSSLSVAMCLAHALCPKDKWLRDFGIQARWPMFGIPERLHTDNAREFWGEAIVRGCEQYGITLEHRPVGSPYWGGHIERYIGTLMGRIHLLPGTTFSSVRDRGDYESERKACLTLGELQEWLVHEICNHYHVRKHRGIGMSPLQKWEQGFGAPNHNTQEVHQ